MVKETQLRQGLVVVGILLGLACNHLYTTVTRNKPTAPLPPESLEKFTRYRKETIDQLEKHQPTRDDQ